METRTSPYSDAERRLLHMAPNGPESVGGGVPSVEAPGAAPEELKQSESPDGIESTEQAASMGKERLDAASNVIDGMHSTLDGDIVASLRGRKDAEPEISAFESAVKKLQPAQAVVDVGEGATGGVLGTSTKKALPESHQAEVATTVGDGVVSAQLGTSAETAGEGAKEPAASPEKKAPTTQGEQLQHSLDSALATLQNPDAKPSDKAAAAVLALGALAELFRRAVGGTLNEPLAATKPKEGGKNDAEAAGDATKNTDDAEKNGETAGRRERLRKDIEKRGFDAVLKSKEKTKERLSEMNSEAVALDKEAGRLEGAINADKKRISALEREKATASGDEKADIQEQIDTIEGRVRMNTHIVDAVKKRREELRGTLGDRYASVQKDIEELKTMKREAGETVQKANDALRKIADGLPGEAKDLKSLLQAMTFTLDQQTLKISVGGPVITAITGLAEKYGVALKDDWKDAPRNVLAVLQNIMTAIATYKEDKGGEEEKSGDDGGPSDGGKGEQKAKESSEGAPEIHLDTLLVKAREYIANMVGDEPGVRSAISLEDAGGGLVRLRIDTGVIRERTGQRGVSRIKGAFTTRKGRDEQFDEQADVFTATSTPQSLEVRLREVQDRNNRKKWRGQIAGK